jgi:hypothetical protein
MREAWGYFGLVEINSTIIGTKTWKIAAPRELENHWRIEDWLEEEAFACFSSGCSLPRKKEYTYKSPITKNTVFS